MAIKLDEARIRLLYPAQISGNVQINGGTISYKTTNYTSNPILVYDDATTYGHTLLVGAGGTTYIGAGEAASTLYSKLGTKSSEYLILGADSNIQFYTGADSATSTSGVTLDSNKYFYPQTTNTGSIGTSSYKWASMYATTFYGALNGNATSATKATQDGAGNVITSKYVTIDTTQTISGAKTFSSAPTAAYYITNKTVAAAPDGTAEGWYRCATFTSDSGTSNNFILSIRRSYYSPENEGYLFSISNAYTSVNITQLNGSIGGHLLTKIRVNIDENRNIHVDYYMKSNGVASYKNGWYISGFGDGTVYTPYLVSSYTGTVTEFETVEGLKNNIGYIGNATTATTANKTKAALTLNGKTFNGSTAINMGVLAPAYGGTGKTTLIDASNALLNALSIGSSTPADADYYISQYVGGGTTTTTYHRRPMSALWAYIQGKSDSRYVNVSGDTMTGQLTVPGFFYNSGDATLKIYASTNTSYGTETISIQTAFDAVDGQTHDYVTSYENRCNLLLQPRGGQVYIGKNQTSVGNTTYTLLTGGPTYIGGRLVVAGNGSSYNEGIRILPASNGWSNVFFSANTTVEGTHDGGWLIGRRGAAGSVAGAVGDFTIEEENSTGVNLTIHKNSGGATLQGALKVVNGNIYINSTSGNGTGLSLYNTSAPTTYGIHMSTTANHGKHGDVQSDWATYFHMNAVGQRGWVYRAGTTNVASVSANGVGTFAALAQPESRIIAPQGGNYYTSTSTKTGYLKITLPVSWTGAMIKFNVDIYDYRTNNTITYTIGGYNYSTGWVNTSAYNNAPWTFSFSNLPVQFGHDGSKCAIYIGNANTSWSYPQVMVRDVLIGYGQYGQTATWSKGWSIDFTTTLGTISGTTASNPNTGYSVNYASSAGNADTTDSLHVHTGRNNEANKIVRTDGNGYIQCGYINSSNGNEGNNSNPPRVWGTNGSDNYLRTYLTSALSVGYASLLSIHNTVTSTTTRSTNASSWNGGISGVKYMWGQAFKDTSIGTDTGDIVFAVRAGQYTSGGTELCVCIDGDYYSMGNKVLHAGNYSSYALPKSGGTLTGDLTFAAAKNINMTYNGSKVVLCNHNNGNVSLSALGSGLYVGYQNTTSIVFGASGAWGTMTSAGLSMPANTQISNADTGSSWILGRVNAAVRMTTSTSSSSFSPVVSSKTQLGSWDLGPCHPNEHFYFSYATDTNYNAGTNSTMTSIYFEKEGNIRASKVYGAVWNDYAEYRWVLNHPDTDEPIESGRCVAENGNDSMSLTHDRLQAGARIISDTYGMCMGETEKAKTPIAVCGRVLAYPFERKVAFNVGDPVCSGPNGTVSKMSREEAMMYPERIVGTVVSKPTYKEWGPNKIPVKGRIWIQVR